MFLRKLQSAPATGYLLAGLGLIVLGASFASRYLMIFFDEKDFVGALVSFATVTMIAPIPIWVLGAGASLVILLFRRKIHVLLSFSANVVCGLSYVSYLAWYVDSTGGGT